MLLLRRFLFVTLLITLTVISSRLLIGILMFFQFMYGAYVVYTRPYKDTKSNIIEIINEIYFSLFLVTLMIFNTEDEWTPIRTNIYVWILVSNSLIVFLIVFVYSIKMLIIWFKSKWERRSDDQEEISKVSPLPSIISATNLHSDQPTENRRVLNVLSVLKENKQKEE